jgi:hypothetical protein
MPSMKSDSTLSSIIIHAKINLRFPLALFI